MIKNTTKPLSDLRIAALAPDSLFGTLLKMMGPLLDQILGISQLRAIYHRHALSGLDKQTFSKQILQILGINVIGAENVLNKIPKKGPCIVVCNHPYGMIEGVIIAHLLTGFRSDTKIMANIGLQLFKEIKDYFIFANPLQPKAPINISAIKQCFKHLHHEGLLVIFPAGRVSFFQKEKNRVTDGEWDRLAVQLAIKTKAPILPLFISGTNSSFFYRMGRIYYRFRLLMLVREFLKLRQQTICLQANHVLTTQQLMPFITTKKMNTSVRLHCYLNDPDYQSNWPKNRLPSFLHPISSSVDKELIFKELNQLPTQQHLLRYQSFSVYYGYQQQIPYCVQEITRLREITFRTLNEGSGQPSDTDHFDATYLHLFVFDHQNKMIIGAYRIGQTDVLQQQGGLSALYLSQMFRFYPEFVNQQQPCLELGRSFVVDSHQNSFYGLMLLWKGIGAFVCQHPQYQRLYGTVSLSKLYDPRSVAIIEQAMVSDSRGVQALTALNITLPPEVNELIATQEFSIKQLAALVKVVEKGARDIPILLKQYYKLGAVFHCLGIDTHFNDTPGLLLSVELAQAPAHLLQLYLGEGRSNYLRYAQQAKQINASIVI